MISIIVPVTNKEIYQTMLVNSLNKQSFRDFEIIEIDAKEKPFNNAAEALNYGVSLAELIIPAADVSEQISTAGKEASGTSNMKFMMNGAVTLGTMDGANIEIVEKAGAENAVIFGLRDYEVEDHYRKGDYSAWQIYNSDPTIKKIMDSLLNGPWVTRADRFRLIFDEIMNGNDNYFLFADFASYRDAQAKINDLYQNRLNWQKMCLMNIANSSTFSSDRTIEEYVRDIWHLKKVKYED